MEHARRMLNTLVLDDGFWVEVINTFANLINLSPATTLNGKILECGKPIDYSHLHTFGSNLFSHVLKKRGPSLTQIA